MQFIGYSIDGYHIKSVPVATGRDRDEVLALTIRRTLGAGCGTGLIQVQQRDDVSADDFAELTDTLDRWFDEKGITGLIDGCFLAKDMAE